eukprot:PLAT9950.1.p1 GENE.PLAT9950.1~~PLAT9950.1.p1  ORF type:complete len:546 (-),score=191.68 PLAT9950.1:139-1776(-)
MEAPLIVVGGGVAGVACAEELARLAPDKQVLLLSASAVLKGIRNQVRLTDNLAEFELAERPLAHLERKLPNLTALREQICFCSPEDRLLRSTSGKEWHWEALCLAMGARPALVGLHDSIMGLRDTETVEALASRLASARHVLLLGNGGIAMEFAHTVTHCEVSWAVKDDYIGNTFFDASASAFFLSSLRSDEEGKEEVEEGKKEDDAEHGDGEPAGWEEEAGGDLDRLFGNAIGPQWVEGIPAAEECKRKLNILHRLHITAVRFSCEKEWTPCVSAEEMAAARAAADALGDAWTSSIDATSREGWPTLAWMSDGRVLGVDFILSATGVTPNSEWCRDVLECSDDGGIIVDDLMRTTAAPHIFAAGDVCSLSNDSQHWFQMRLWSQAHTMGQFAAQAMLGEVDELGGGLHFELFAHATRFFGFKVVLLGLFNGQGLGDDYEHVIRKRVVTSEGVVVDEGGDGEAALTTAASADSKLRCDVEVLLRITPGEEYIKLVLLHGRLQGAMLIGETDLEETFENLILNQLDLSAYGADLLDDSIDIEDYFD